MSRLKASEPFFLDDAVTRPDINQFRHVNVFWVPIASQACYGRLSSVEKRLVNSRRRKYPMTCFALRPDVTPGETAAASVLRQLAKSAMEAGNHRAAAILFASASLLEAALPQDSRERSA